MTLIIMMISIILSNARAVHVSSPHSVFGRVLAPVLRVPVSP